MEFLSKMTKIKKEKTILACRSLVGKPCLIKPIMEESVYNLLKHRLFYYILHFGIYKCLYNEQMTVP